VLILGLAGCGVRLDPALNAEPVGMCGLLADVVAAGAAGALVVDPTGEALAATGWAVGAEPALGAASAPVWLVEPETALDPPEVVPDAPVGCAVTCPIAGWLPGMWVFDAAPAVPGEPGAVPVSEPSNALTLPAV